MTPPRNVILVGNVIDRLRDLPADYVHCVVTSPPYFGLRAYGTDPQVWGGDPACAHDWNDAPLVQRGGTVGRNGTRAADERAVAAEQNKVRAFVPGAFCQCGAWLGELGLEPTPDLYLEHLVLVFREVHRVLHPTGVCWLNLGDSYAGSGRGGYAGGASTLQGTTDGQDQSRVARGSQKAAGKHEDARQAGAVARAWTPAPPGLKPKDLIGVPWRAALAMQGFVVLPAQSFSRWADQLAAARDAEDWEAVRIVEDVLRHHDFLSRLQATGWYLRCDVIWAKPNPMPESTQDRPTRSHEYVFQLTKSSVYFYDRTAILEPFAESSLGRYELAANRPNPTTNLTSFGAGLPSPDPARHSYKAGQGRVREREGGHPADHLLVGGPSRPQLTRAIELARKARLTQAHLEAIRTCGIAHTGKSSVTQQGAGKSDLEAQRLAEEARRALKGYYKEFLTPAGRQAAASWDTRRKDTATAHLAGRAPAPEPGLPGAFGVGGRNKRSVWVIPTQPFAEAHFATFPEDLVEPCVLAGTSAHGACAQCGEPWARIVARPSAPRARRKTADSERDGGLTAEDGLERTGMSHFQYDQWLKANPPTTKGWEPGCDCGAPVVPCVVFDPFFGSGTVGLVARRLGRDWLGTELKQEYADMAYRRLAPVMNHRLNDPSWEDQ